MLVNGSNEIDLTMLVREHGPGIIERVTEEYSRHLSDDFATDTRHFAASKISVEGSADFWHVDPHMSFSGKAQRITPVWTIISRKSPGSPIVNFAASHLEIGDPQLWAFSQNGTFSDQVLPIGQLNQEEIPSLATALSSDLASWMLNIRRRQPPIIFPAERIATTIFWRELLLKRTEIVDQILAMQDQPPQTAVEHVRSQAQRYPRPIRDSLRMAADLEPWSRQTSEFADLADYFEENLLGGKVRLSPYGQLVFVPAQRTDVVLDVQIAASMVKSLSLLVFYLRHRAQTGDLIIIDEPELNLHPDNQRLIARVLARAVNRGLKVIASTHSNYLVRELNNLILLGQDTEAIKALRQKHGYDESELLKPEQLGVYLFRDSKAEPVPVDETGFSIETIDAEIDRLNAVSQELYATILEQEP
jgi:hypothetical protein